jgi:pimeloyl-ACP methyl ester carboxylesterase
MIAVDAQREMIRGAQMQNPRKYGKPPYSAVLVHGGPGAAGEMAPVAAFISASFGVLEPMQTKDSISGQVDELRSIIANNAAGPAALAGYSWGAWLSVIYAATHPDEVRKLVLISCAPFKKEQAGSVMAERMRRLGRKEIEEIEFLMDAVDNPAARNRDGILKRIGELMAKADVYEASNAGQPKIKLDSAIYAAVWKEASGLRDAGGLVEYARMVRCPVAAIHGDHDPHPAGAVKEAFPAAKFVLLEKCGHTPWMEKYAAAAFYEALLRELE